MIDVATLLSYRFSLRYPIKQRIANCAAQEERVFDIMVRYTTDRLPSHIQATISEASAIDTAARKNIRYLARVFLLEYSLKHEKKIISVTKRANESMAMLIYGK
jgi:hypothetical protein